MKFYSLEKLIKIFQDYHDNTISDRFFINDTEIKVLIKRALIKRKLLSDG